MGCVADPAAKPDERAWKPLGGQMVFAPFKQNSDYFAADKAFMRNCRMSDLNNLPEGLRAAHVAIITKRRWNDPSVGRFARIHDPEGNAIELWEPPAPKKEN